MILTKFVRLALCFLAVGALTSPALAIQVGPGAFSGGATVESFEGLSPGPNIPTSSNYGPQFLVPGDVGPYTFSSGATLTSPVPNTNDAVLVVVGDYSFGEADWGLIGNGVIESAADVPSGTAYLGDCCPNGDPLTFEFPTDMLRVGIYATDADGNSITMSAYDFNGSFLESVTLSSVPVGSWGSNFLGIENAAGIRSILLSSSGPNSLVPVYDDLTFEAVPEPSTAFTAMLGAMLCSLGKRRRSN